MKIRIPNGAYLITFGVDGVMEGNTVAHLEGVDDANHFMESLVEYIKNLADERTRELLENCGKRLIIRNIQRIGDVVE